MFAEDASQAFVEAGPRKPQPPAAARLQAPGRAIPHRSNRPGPGRRNRSVRGLSGPPAHGDFGIAGQPDGRFAAVIHPRTAAIDSSGSSNPGSSGRASPLHRRGRRHHHRDGVAPGTLSLRAAPPPQASDGPLRRGRPRARVGSRRATRSASSPARSTCWPSGSRRWSRRNGGSCRTCRTNSGHP